jgi:hypothetical protein
VVPSPLCGCAKQQQTQIHMFLSLLTEQGKKFNEEALAMINNQHDLDLKEHCML